MKKIVLIVSVILLAMTAMPAWAEEENLPPDPSSFSGRFTGDHQGEYIIFDALILRPLGLVAMGVGAATGLAAVPMAAPSRSQDRVVRELYQKPYWYTFCRPIGDIDF